MTTLKDNVFLINQSTASLDQIQGMNWLQRISIFYSKPLLSKQVYVSQLCCFWHL